ncbi:hypothetical protein BGZ70_009752 [Mortierella alpina]|uniref:Uncharacterized protein n=1 Tax=Mortierella alpina TaxID=64518 RepID=A0A9P6J3V4_MORAP|nr:hypothetical protein BGZ70_009752 [Mortierella alpina]
MVSDSTKKTLVISASAIVGLTTISALAYLLIQDDRRAKHQRKIRSLQKALGHKLGKVESSVESLIEGEIRLAQVRTKTLRTHRLYAGDSHVQLPSLGLINEQDKVDLGEEIEETSDELIRERTQGYADDAAKVRQAYKRLDFLVQSVNEQLLRLLESLDAISPRELTDLGDGSGGIASANGPEVAAFEKIRKRKRADVAKIQKLMVQMDKIGASFKERVAAVEEYERKEAEAAAAAAEEAKNKKAQEAEDEKKREEEKEEEEQDHHTNGHAEVKEGLSFAEVTKHNIPEPEILEPTEDLEKMKEGITFADVVSHNAEDHHREHSDSTTSTTTTTTTTTTSSSSSTTLVQETDHLEKVQAGISYAEVASHHTPADHHTAEVEEHRDEVLEQTEDLEKMKEGITFAEVVSHHVEEPVEKTVEEAAAVEVAAAQ